MDISVAVLLTIGRGFLGGAGRVYGIPVYPRLFAPPRSGWTGADGGGRG
jgi:hypothetical protein